MGSEATIQDRLEACAHEDAPEPSDILCKILTMDGLTDAAMLLSIINPSSG